MNPSCKTIIIGVALACVAISSAAQQTRIVYGRVVGEADGLPLVGAVVAVEDRTASCVSDWNGNFRLPIPFEDTSIIAELPGYGPFAAKLAPGLANIRIDIALSVEVIEMEDVTVTAVAEPVVSVARFSVQDAEAIPTGGNPVDVAVTLPDVDNYADMLGGSAIEGFPGSSGRALLKSYNPGMVFYGADPSWTSYLYDYIPVPRAMHFIGYPSSSSILPNSYLGETEVYDLVSPLRYGATASGLVRLTRAELGYRVAGGGMSADSANVFGGASAKNQNFSASLHKSLFEFTIFPFEDMNAKAQSFSDYTTRNFGKIKGNGGFVAHYGNGALDWNSLGIDVLAVYDAGALVSKRKSDEAVVSPSHIYQGLDYFISAGFDDSASLSDSVSLNADASIGYQKVDVDEARHLEGLPDLLLGREDEELLRARGHLDLRAKYFGALNAELGMNYDYQRSIRSLFNLVDGVDSLQFVSAFRLPTTASGPERSDAWTATSHSLTPYLQAGWNAELWSLGASVGALIQPDRDMWSPAADAKADFSFLDGSVSLSLQAGLRPQALSGSILTQQSMYLDTEDYGIDPVSTQQKTFSSGVKGSFHSGSQTLKAGGYFRYYYDLSGYNLQSWFTQIKASDKSGNVSYYPSDILLLPQSDQGRSFGGDVEYSREIGQYKVNVSYILSKTEYHSDQYGWVRANTDVRHVLKATFLYKPNQVFLTGTNFFIYADQPFTPTEVRSNESGTLYQCSAAPNSGSDIVPRVKLDIVMTYRFKAFKRAEGKIYLNTCNLLASLNQAIVGLLPSLESTEGATTADYSSRVYRDTDKFSLVGTNVGIEMRY